MPPPPTIYHISDLHIRSGDEVKCRYQEYKFVFKRFVEHIQKNNKLAITIITGDIFHHKSKIESPGISLFYNFIQQVAKITPVYIIRGNHDFKQWETNEVDLISSMLIPKINNVTYLNSTGTYTINDDIGFGVLAIQDVLKSGASNSRVHAQGFSFPDPNDLKTRYKIALYHGQVENNQMFKGYDVALLGDVHIQMVKDANINELDFESNTSEHIKCLSTYTWDNTKCPWGYSGSMIRQNVGETIEGHGFLEWNLEDKIVKSYHINNIVDIAAATAEHELFNTPRNLEVCERSKSPDEKTRTEEISEHLSVKNTPEMWAKYIAENGKVVASDKLVRNPELLFVRDINENEAIRAKVVDRNLKIKKKYEAYIDSIGKVSGNKSPFRMLKMTWDWLLCYGADNQFYFNTLDGKVSTISGRNGHGKTSFLEIILLALYGQGFPSRNNKNNTSTIINIRKPPNMSSNVSLTLQIDDIGMIRIKRIFQVTSKPVPSSNKNTLIDKWDKHGSTWVSVVSGKVAVDKWIESNIGSIQSFLLSCMVSQNADCDFFAMSPTDQKELLDNALCIDAHTRYIELIKESRLAHQVVSDLVASSLAMITKRIENVDMSTYKYRIEELDRQIEIPKDVGYVGELKPRSYYENIIAANNSKRNICDIIYDLEQIKRAHANIHYKRIEQYDKPIEWFEDELEFMNTKIPHPPPKRKNVVYDEEIYNKYLDLQIDLELQNESGYDQGPYNYECICCIERKDAYNLRNHYNTFIDQWWAKKTYLENAIASIKYQKITKLENELKEAKAFEKAYQNAIHVLESYDDIIKANENVKLQIEHARLKKEYDTYDQFIKEKEYYKTIQKDLSDIIVNIYDVQFCLDNYIHWLYTHNVLPLVEKYTNEIMNLIDPNLKLHGTLIEGGKGFEWSITTHIDGQYERSPTIEKASGFQRFICGLAVRIALGTIGASGIKPRQLFLDEGFTSCDSGNLAKVPDFLTMLLQLYDSILLVTHLEDLKDFCVATTIQITRDIETGTSQIK